MDDYSRLSDLALRDVFRDVCQGYLLRPPRIEGLVDDIVDRPHDILQFLENATSGTNPSLQPLNDLDLKFMAAALNEPKYYVLQQWFETEHSWDRFKNAGIALGVAGYVEGLEFLNQPGIDAEIGFVEPLLSDDLSFLTENSAVLNFIDDLERGQLSPENKEALKDFLEGVACNGIAFNSVARMTVMPDHVEMLYNELTAELEHERSQGYPSVLDPYDGTSVPRIEFPKSAP